MAIEQAKRSNGVKTLPGGYWENTAPWLCYCDFCGKPAYKNGNDAGEAADNARKDGFSTIRAKLPALPSKWACKTCAPKVKK